MNIIGFSTMQKSHMSLVTEDKKNPYIKEFFQT